MRYLIILILSFCIQSVQAFEFPATSELWLREAPPNANMLAAYVTIDNHTEQDLKLIGAYAPDFGKAEIHKTIEVDGMLKMREQKELLLPHAGQVVMKPGGLHIMLMMPKQSFKVGEVARICLIYQDESGAEQVQHLDFPVKQQ